MMTDRLDAAMEAAITEKRIVGGVLLVCERGETVYARAIGLSDRTSGRVMEVTDRFRLASVTKPIATACFMSLVEDGTLSLSDPVTISSEIDPSPAMTPRFSKTPPASRRFVEPAISSR